MSQTLEKTKPIRLDCEIIGEVTETIKNRPEYPTEKSFIEEATRRFIDQCKGVKH